MVRHYCTECLSTYGKYYDLKILYVRRLGKFEPSELYRCTNCGLIACGYYGESFRALGNHIVRSFEEVRET